MINLNESVKNLLDTRDDKIKIKYTDQVWEILQDSYKSQGGIKGNGFKTKKDMLNIPFWKLDIVDEKVLCVIMYKYSKTGNDDVPVRKLCALGIVGDSDRKTAKTKLKNIIRYEFDRSLMEVSGLLEDYIKFNFPNEYKKYMFEVETVAKIMYTDVIIPIDEFRYKREIGGGLHEKVMLGTSNKKY
jgi:hypothetical protein